MRLIKYLNEGRSQTVDRDFALDFLKKNCESLKSEIYRGVDEVATDDYLFVQPSKFERISRNTEYNYYTLLLDNLPSWKKYPKRSKSIICSTDFYYAVHYGKMFRVIFQKGSNIGICPKNDIWGSFTNIFSDGFDVLNYFLSRLFKQLEKIKIISIIDEPNTYIQLTRNFQAIDDWKELLIDDVTSSYDEEDNSEEMERSEAINNIVDLIDENALFDFGVYDYEFDHDMKKILISYFQSGKDFVDFINSKFNPTNGEFKLMKAGQSLPPKREVWSDGNALLVNPELLDTLITELDK